MSEEDIKAVEDALLGLLERVRKGEFTFIAATLQGGEAPATTLIAGDFDHPVQPLTMLGALHVLQSQVEAQIGAANMRRALQESMAACEAKEHKAAGGSVQ